jgi:ribulose kinase
MNKIVPVYLSIDVGTGSARAALFDDTGRCIARGEAPFPTHNPRPDYFEQSTVLILSAVRASVQQLIERVSQARALLSPAETKPSALNLPVTGTVSGPPAPPPTLLEELTDEDTGSIWHLCGIGVDATCSLVVVSPEQAAFFSQTVSAEPITSTKQQLAVPGGISISPPSIAASADYPDTIWDVIVWMDHRAEAEAAEINTDETECSRDILRFYGGCLSPESEPPKLVWLHRHRPEALARAAAVMDLSDFLVFALTGNLHARGLCPLAAKWAFRTDEMRWDRRFYERWGLGDLFSRGCLGRETHLPGQRVSGLGSSSGLSKIASMLLFGASAQPGPASGSWIREESTCGTNTETAALTKPTRLVWNFEDIVVASGMVDAHAGAIGALSMRVPSIGERFGPRSLQQSRDLQSLPTDHEKQIILTQHPGPHAAPKATSRESGAMVTEIGTISGRQLSGNAAAPILSDAPVPSADDPRSKCSLTHAVSPQSLCSGEEHFDWSQRIAIIAGTSTCHMICARQAIFARGVWGPHRSAVLPNMWLNEGGQSVTGRLLDYLVESHAASLGLSHLSTADIHGLLCQLGLHQMHRAASIHVYPDFHGNRSFLADPRMSGAIVGLRLDTFTRVEAFSALYLATVQALGYGTRQIIEHLNEAGHDIRLILLCGGMLKNDLFVRCLADTCQMPVVFAERPFDVMLLGGAICARAAHLNGDLFGVISSMNGGPNQRFHRLDPQLDWQHYHEAKYRIFLRMQEEQLRYRREMAGVFS